MRSLIAFAMISVLFLACDDEDDDEDEGDAGRGEDICANTDECPGELICSYGLCRLPCTYDRDCPEGACVTSPGDSDIRTCVVVSEEREECPAELVLADDGLCRDSCTSEDDCGDGRDCDDGACVDDP